MSSRMDLRRCCRGAQQLLQCFLICGRHCYLQLQHVLHMKARGVINRTGRTWKWLWSSRREPPYQVRVLLVGRRFSGKTAFVYRLKLGAFIPTKPSIDSNTESFVIRLRTKPGSSPVRAQEHFSAGEDLKTDAIDIESGTAAFSGTTVRVAFCDVAGGDGESLEWQGLQRECDCVCFALDSTAHPTGIEDARRELLELFYDEHFVLHRGTPFLVVATKQDICSARSAAEIERLLELPEEVRKTYEQLVVNSRCQVFGCSALSGAGLIEVQQWLAAAAVAVSKSNSYWPPSSCRSFHRDTSRPLSACDSTSFRDRRDEMLGTFATATPPGSQAGLSLAPGQHQEVEAVAGTPTQAVQTPVVLEERVAALPHLLDGPYEQPVVEAVGEPPTEAVQSPVLLEHRVSAFPHLLDNP